MNTPEKTAADSNAVKIQDGQLDSIQTPTKSPTQTPTKNSLDNSNQDLPSTPKKAKYYASPPTTPSSTSQTPTKYATEDLTGYIVNVTDSKSSGKSGNMYFDIHFKISPKEQMVVRVMKKTNASIKRKFFLDHIKKPVKLCNLSKGNDVTFYNSYYGSFLTEAKLISFKYSENYIHKIEEIKEHASGSFNVKGSFKWTAEEKSIEKKDGTTERLREGVIVDQSKSFIPVSIWGNHIDDVENEKVHEFTQLQLKYYYSIQKLSTTKITKISVSQETINVNWTGIAMIDWEKIEKENRDALFPTINRAVFVSCEVEIYPKCISCNKKITVPEGEKRFSCPLCNRRLLSSKLPIGFIGKVDVEDKEELIPLTLFSDVLFPILGDNVLEKYQNKKSDLEDSILDLSEEVNITYSSSKKTVTKITPIEEEEDLM